MLTYVIENLEKLPEMSPNKYKAKYILICPKHLWKTEWLRFSISPNVGQFNIILVNRNDM
jgi:hypothetical protein